MNTSFEIQRQYHTGATPDIRTISELELEGQSIKPHSPDAASPDSRFETRSESFYIDRPRGIVWGSLVDVEFWKKAFGYEQIVMTFSPGATFIGSGRRGGFPFNESGEFVDLKKDLAIQFDVWSSLLSTEQLAGGHHRVTVTLKDAWKGTRVSVLETWHRPPDPDALLRKAWIDRIHVIGPLIAHDHELSEENNYHV